MYRSLFLLCLIFVSSLQANLSELESQLKRELRSLDYPANFWRCALEDLDGQPILDVAIVGAGMAGLTAAFALKREGITNICLFDENQSGLEGPWLTYARMKYLRSPKSLMGPAQGIPNLTLRAWYEAEHGIQAWKEMESVPTSVWMDYLNWYKKILNLPVESEVKILSIQPDDQHLTLQYKQSEQVKTILAKKVVLATGRKGFGGLEIPESITKIPKSLYGHSGDNIDFDKLKNKRIAVIGSGASAFDAAAVALESGAFKVDLLLRRSFVPYVNKYVEFAHPGIVHGFYHLPDHIRCLFLSYAAENGVPPPKDALIRVRSFLNFQVIPNSSIDPLSIDNEEVIIQTGRGAAKYDFILLGTGFSVDGSKCQILNNFYDKILLWSDIHTLATSKLGHFPYLGSHFQFLEKEPGAAPYLKHIYCFNYGATLSHGLLSSDIPNISKGALKLAAGIAADLFTEDASSYFQKLQESNFVIFNPEEFPFLP